MNDTQATFDDLLLADLVFAEARRLIGFAAADEGQIVVARRGALSCWAPAPGGRVCDCAILTAMDDALEDLKRGDGAPLLIPSVRLEGAEVDRVTIAVLWRPGARRFVILTTPDEGAKQLDRLVYQGRREAQLLRQQAEATADRLRVSDQRYRDIVEATGDVVLRLKPDLSVSFVNAGAAALLGLDPEAALGQPVRAALPLPQGRNPWRADMCAEGPASFEAPARGRGGGLIWLWWNVRWLGDGGGPAEFQAVARDVTQARRLRAELDRANEEAKFAALAGERLRIAHDLHDTFVHSLVALLARLTLLRRAAPEGALKRDLEAAEAEAREGLRAARASVSEIRAASDFPDGPGPAIAAAVEALAAGARIAVAAEIDPALASASPAQAAAMARVAREALRNVALHSGARGASVIARRDAGTLVLTVADDGVGFDPERPRDGHYGLVGMAEQARLVGGTLTIDSPPGGGARLSLSIPCE